MKTALQLLIEARALIADPAHWTQGCSARNAEGTLVSVSDPNAVSFCSFSALCVTEGEYSGTSLDTALSELRRVSGFHSVMVFNDAAGRTHAEVLATFDTAIQNLSKRESEQVTPF